MHIFVVNLDKDKARMHSIKSQLERLGLEFERIAGVFGPGMSKDEWRAHYSPNKARWRQSRELSPAEVGCSLSHLLIYRQMAMRKISAALVLEDDVIVPEDLEFILNHFDHTLDCTEASIVLLSDVVAASRQSGCLPDGRKIARVKSAYYTSSYIVTGEAASRMLADFYPVGQVADSWNRLVKHKIVDVMAVRPEVIPQDQELFGSSTTEGVIQVLGEHPLAVPMYKLRRVRAVVSDFLSPLISRRKQNVPNSASHPIDQLFKIVT